MDFNPEAMHNAMSEGVRFKNQAFAAMEKGNYKKAVESFEKGLALMESGFGRDTPSTSPYLVGMSEAYIKLNEWDNAEKPAKRLLKKGRRNEDDSDIKTATELLSEIEIGRNGGKPVEQEQDENANANANEDPKCITCKTATAEFRCSSCKLANYCSRECQRADWPKHKSSCYTNTLKVQNAAEASSSSETKSANKKEEKPRCGLCGFQGSRSIKIGKTECCGNWICMDMETYELMSYRLNSCHRNHDRYTLCGYHYHEGHKGAFADCFECNMSRDCMHGIGDAEIAWKKFCNRHFYFDKIGEKEMKRNRELKKDGTKAMLQQINLN